MPIEHLLSGPEACCCHGWRPAAVTAGGLLLSRQAVSESLCRRRHHLHRKTQVLPSELATRFACCDLSVGPAMFFSRRWMFCCRQRSSITACLICTAFQFWRRHHLHRKTVVLPSEPATQRDTACLICTAFQFGRRHHLHRKTVVLPSEPATQRGTARLI